MRKILLAFLLFSCSAFAQVAVGISPQPHIQFLDANGHPLSGGKVFTYDAGTTTLRNTYKNAGGVAQNTDPIILNAGGFADIWLANQGYKFCVYNSLMALQYPCTDNVQSYLGVLNTANTWSQPQTFSSTITHTLTDNQFIIGAPGAQATLDFPPPIGPITLHFPNTSDTMVGRATTDTLTNKTLASPAITGSVTINGLPWTPYTVVRATTSVTQTGDTATHTLYTLNIPGGALTTTGILRLTCVMAVGSNAGAAGLTVTYGGTRISSPTTIPAGLANKNGIYLSIVGGNLGVTNSQSWDTQDVPLNSSAAPTNTSFQTTAIDSTVSQPLLITYTGGVNSDSITLHRCTAEIF